MKRSLRDFLLTLALAALIFTIVAFFLIQLAEGLMNDVIDKIGAEGTQETVTAQGETNRPASASPVPDGKEDKTITFLMLGIDHSKNYADAIFLVGIDGENKKATISLIPSDCDYNGQALGSAYRSHNINLYKNYVAEKIGVTVDFYAVVNMSGFANMIDFLGGIQYAVPEDMYCFDPATNFRVSLRAGNQTLNGDQALQLVSYDHYTGSDTREGTQLNFCRTFCQKFLIPQNLSLVRSKLYNFYYSVETDFDESDLNALGEIIFNFDAYQLNAVRIPGSQKDGLYQISSAASALFESYR